MAFAGVAMIVTALALATAKITDTLTYDVSHTGIALVMVAWIVIGGLPAAFGERIADVDWINRKLNRLPGSLRVDARSLIDDRLSKRTPVSRDFVRNAISQARQAARASTQRALLR